MSPEEQQTAIGQLCGFTEEEPWLKGRRRWSHKDHPHAGFAELPDYLSDLNVMRDVVVELIHPDPHLRRRYYQMLDVVTGDQWNTIDATAAQRAEALLRVKDRWNNKPNHNDNRKKEY